MRRKFFQKFGDIQGHIIQKIQWIFGDDTMGKNQIKKWYNFSEERVTLRQKQGADWEGSVKRQWKADV